jgi:hypothetical protein
MESRTRLRFWNGNTVKGSLRNDDIKTENGKMKVYYKLYLLQRQFLLCRSMKSWISQTETLFSSDVLKFYT